MTPRAITTTTRSSPPGTRSRLALRSLGRRSPLEVFRSISKLRAPIPIEATCVDATPPMTCPRPVMPIAATGNISRLRSKSSCPPPNGPSPKGPLHFATQPALLTKGEVTSR